MNDAHKALLGLYQIWSKLTNAETDAIQQEDWPRLANIQNEKTLLQEKIGQAEQAPGGSDRSAPFWREQLRPTIEVLLRQEQFNQEQLRRKRAEVQHQKALAQSAGRSLRRIHGAYVPLRVGGWQSYS
jgi:hypothetical protein